MRSDKQYLFPEGLYNDILPNKHSEQFLPHL